LRLMHHFQIVRRGAVHLAVNERLIEDTEAEVRRLLEFVGVPFDAACLAFHRNRRPVNTPSAEQVRRPINRGGMDHWRHFKEWLGPLKGAARRWKAGARERLTDEIRARPTGQGSRIRRSSSFPAI